MHPLLTWIIFLYDFSFSSRQGSVKVDFEVWPATDSSPAALVIALTEALSGSRSKLFPGEECQDFHVVISGMACLRIFNIQPRTNLLFIIDAAEWVVCLPFAVGDDTASLLPVSAFLVTVVAVLFLTSSVLLGYLIYRARRTPPPPPPTAPGPRRPPTPARGAAQTQRFHYSDISDSESSF